MFETVGVSLFSEDESQVLQQKIVEQIHPFRGHQYFLPRNSSMALISWKPWNQVFDYISHFSPVLTTFNELVSYCRRQFLIKQNKTKIDKYIFFPIKQ
jgi:hypothetical protein